jgi:hypothetical protein
MTVIACVCPPKPDGSPRHEHDTIKLRPKLDFRSALWCRNTIVVVRTQDPDAGEAEMMAAMAEAFLMVGIESWSLVDAKGKLVPVSRRAVRQFMDDNVTEAMKVSDDAVETYYAAVIDPLVKAASTSSPRTPTTDLTSRTSGSSRARRKPSKPSLITTSRTDVIEPISASHGGGYSS